VIFAWSLVLPAAFYYFLVTIFTIFMVAEAANFTLKTIGGFFPRSLGDGHSYVNMYRCYTKQSKYSEISQKGGKKLKHSCSHKK
jgi:hypothetical protein